MSDPSAYCSGTRLDGGDFGPSEIRAWFGSSYWRHPRRRLTKRERGPPIHWFPDALEGGGLKVQRLGGCDFPSLPQAGDRMGFQPNSAHFVLCK